MTHEVTNEGNDRAQLSPMAKQAKAVLGSGQAGCGGRPRLLRQRGDPGLRRADITVTLPKPLTSGAKAQGRFGKQDFRYLADEDVYICPAGERLTYRFTQRRTWTDPAPLLDQRLR